MRFISLIVATLVAVAIGVSRGAITLPAQLVQAATSLRSAPAQVNNIHVDPVQAFNKVLPQILNGSGAPAQVNNINVDPVHAYNKVLPQILNGGGSSAMDFHGSPVTIPPGSFAVPGGLAVNPGAIAKSGAAASILSQVQQNNARMQDMAAYARNPAGWHGAPPH